MEFSQKNSGIVNRDKTISISGCGWLGFDLAAALAADGYKVNGSNRSLEKASELKLINTEPFVIDLATGNYSPNLSEFLDCDTLIINIPPGRGTGDSDHFKQIKNFTEKLPAARRIIYVSSTSVYADSNREVKEDDSEIPETGNGRVLRSTENHLLEKFQSCVILRFGGLIGQDRNPVKYFAGRTSIPGGNNPVNLIHKEDCIAIIKRFIDNEEANGIYNACSPEHTSKKEFYRKSAEKYSFNIPLFVENTTPHKKVNSDKLIRTLNYEFKYKNPLDMI